MRTGWLVLYSPTLFFQSLYFLFSTTHHFVALQQLQQPPCIWVQQARWSQQPTISVAFCSKGRMIVYDKFIRIQPGHMIQSLCYLQGGGDCLLVECEFHFSFNFCFRTRHCTTSFFTWLQVYWKTQALILMRCVARLWNGLVKTMAFWVCI